MTALEGSAEFERHRSFHDAYDTIDWLVKNVSETTAKVGMLGVHEGFTS